MNKQPKPELGNSFGNPTYAGPLEAMLATQGIPWPRKPLSGKPQLTKGKGGPSRGGKSGKGHSVKLRRSY